MRVNVAGPPASRFEGRRRPAATMGTIVLNCDQDFECFEQGAGLECSVLIPITYSVHGEIYRSANSLRPLRWPVEQLFEIDRNPASRSQLSASNALSAAGVPIQTGPPRETYTARSASAIPCRGKSVTYLTLLGS